MSAKNRRNLNWAALGIALLALDGASLLGAHQTWVWLSNGEGAAVIRAGRVVADRAYATAAGRIADVASDLALRAVERTTSVYALMDSVTPATKLTGTHPLRCRVIKIRVANLKRVARVRALSR